MKKTLRVALMLTVILAISANVWATPVSFTPSPADSSVVVTNYPDGALLLEGTMTAQLALSANPFTLADNETQVLDFFTLSVSGLTLLDSYRIAATLAFSAPPIAGEATGGGIFGTIGGIISGGTLSWDTGTLPDYFTLADGNVVMIDFENDIAIGSFGRTTVHAYVTNLGTAGASAVPEPLTVLLLGLGLVGLSGAGRRLQK